MIINKSKNIEDILISAQISFATFILITLAGLWISKRWSWVTELIMPLLVIGYVVAMCLKPGFLAKKAKKPVL